VLVIFLVVGISMQAQKKKDGTVYNEHPAITAVEAMQKAFVAGDSTAVGTFLSEDFKSYNGSNGNPNQQGTSKQNFLNSVIFWKNNISYFDIVRQDGAYPDAIEYKDGQVWVQTWEVVKGVHNSTGVKLDMPFHRLFLMDENNKILVMFNYYDERVYAEIGRGFEPRTNGTVYDQHENINTSRRLFAALENRDLEKVKSFFDENARIRNVNMPVGETLSVEEDLAMVKTFLDNADDLNFQMVGYPDYVHYERNDSRVVQIWYNIHYTRKSDNKKIALPYHALIDFNEDGKIVSVSAYFSQSIMEN
jgi:ketosteroid isomerase-like protein